MNSELFNNNTDRTVSAIALSHDEARRRHRDRVGTLELLVGILSIESAAAGALQKFGVQKERIQTEVISETSDKQPAVLMFSPTAQTVLESSISLAKSCGEELVCSEHLLLAILNSKESRAVEALHQLKIDIEGLVAELQTLANSKTRVNPEIRETWESQLQNTQSRMLCMEKQLADLKRIPNPDAATMLSAVLRASIQELEREQSDLKKKLSQ